MSSAGTLRRASWLFSTSAAALLFGLEAALATCPNGTGTQTSVTGVNFFSDCTVTNDVTTTGGGGGGSFGALITNVNIGGAFRNTGVMVDGSAQGLALTGGSVGGGIVNSGTIAATGSVGNGAEINFTTIAGGVTNTGVIQGNTSNSQGYGLRLSAATLTGGITNSGLISGGNATGHGLVISGGTFSGGITNTGTITSDQENAFILAVTTLSGGITNTGAITSVYGPALNLSSTSSVEVFNSGTISGATAIIFGGGVNTLTLGAGYSIGSGVLGSGGDDILQLGGSGAAGFDLNSIGTQYTGFGTFNVVGGTWTTTGSSAANWSITGGTMLLGDGATDGSISGSIVADGTLDISQLVAAGTTITSLSGASSGQVNLGGKALTLANASGTFAGVIADGGAGGGTGGSLVLSSGSQILTGANTYTGGTTIFGGTLQLGSGGLTGSILGAITNDGSLSFNRSNIYDTIANGNTISGSGGVVQAGTGTTIFGDGMTYLGQTQILAGTLQIGNGGAEGSIGGGNIVNDATLAINKNAAFALGNNISGAGGLNQIGSGVTTLSGINTYTGATNVEAGTLRAGAVNAFASASTFTVASGATLDLASLNQTIAALAGAGSVTLGSATLTTGGGNASTTFSGVIGGSGGLTKAGSGAFTLAGTNTYNGATSVDGGTLFVNGSIAASAVTVNAGGTLGGSGTVGNTMINGGALAPGNSIGTLTVAGSLSFSAAASYMVEVSPSASDRTDVTGTATLGGATVQAGFAAGAYVNRQYTILHATGGLGGSTFGGLVTSNLPAGFKTELSYDATNAYLNLSMVFVAPPGSGLSGNQQNVGNAIINFFNTNGGIPIAFGGLTPAGLTQISGEVGTASQQNTFNAMNQFMGVMTDPFIAGRGDPVSGGGTPNAYAEEESLAYAARGKSRGNSEREAYAAMHTKAPPVAPSFEQRWSVWGAAYGGSQRTDGNSTVGSNDTRNSLYGIAAGADYRISPDTLAGFALAGGATSFSVANSGGGGRSDLFQAGAFIRHNAGPAYFSAALAYGWQDITTDRTITVAGLDRLRAQFSANAWSGRVEGGYRFVAHGVGITPYAAGQLTTFDLPAYAEQAIVGGTLFALAYTAKSVTDTRSELGLRADKSFAVSNGILTLRGRAAWAHGFNPNRSIGATFQALPGASFVVNGAAIASDSTLVTGSAEMKWTSGWSAAATFEGDFSDVTRSYAGKGVVRYTW